MCVCVLIKSIFYPNVTHVASGDFNLHVNAFTVARMGDIFMSLFILVQHHEWFALIYKPNQTVICFVPCVVIEKLVHGILMIKCLGKIMVEWLIHDMPMYIKGRTNCLVNNIIIHHIVNFNI